MYLKLGISNVSRPVAGDGNCLFYAVAHALLQKDNSIMMATLVERLGCMLDVSQIKLARLLRQATVDEWLGENSSLYQSFLTEDQLQSEAHKFLQDGHYSGDVGDLVLPALVNVISQPVTIFTSAENLPVISLLPMSSIVIDSHPLFLAYNQDGPGHYDAVSFLDQVLEKENVQADIKCTCGRNSTKGISCAYSTYHYSTKCPCFKSDRSCTHSCRCKGCHNPHGARPDIKKLMPKAGLKRRRDRHEYQAYPLKGRKTSKVMEHLSEDVTTGSISAFEYLLISAILQYAYPHLEDWTDVDMIDPDIIAKYFHAIRNMTKVLAIQVPVYNRNQREIETALKHYQCMYDVFYKLHS